MTFLKVRTLLQMWPHERRIIYNWRFDDLINVKWMSITEFVFHDNLAVFEPRSGSEVLDLSQLPSVAIFLRQMTPCHPPQGWNSQLHVMEICPLPPCILTSHAQKHASVTWRDLSINITVSYSGDQPVVSESATLVTPLLRGPKCVDFVLQTRPN
jgi:hypothetical protein